MLQNKTFFLPLRTARPLCVHVRMCVCTCAWPTLFLLALAQVRYVTGITMTPAPYSFPEPQKYRAQPGRMHITGVGLAPRQLGVGAPPQ
jgi:hypothetical protein